MVLLLSMSLLSNGRLNGNRQSEKKEQDRTQHTSAKTIHEQIS